MKPVWKGRKPSKSRISFAWKTSVPASITAAALLILLCLLGTGNATEGIPALSLPHAGIQDPAQTDAVPNRDPFLPGDGGYGTLHPPSVDPGQLDLQAILFHPGQSRALISGHIVSVGDRVFDYTVAEIEPGKVSLQRGKNHYYLFLVLSYENR